MNKVSRKRTERGDYMNKILIAIVLLNTTMFGIGAYMQKQPKFVTLDTQYIVKSLALELAKEDLGKEELEKVLKERIEQMDECVLNLSKDKGYVVLSKAAVITELTDITESVISEVNNVK